MSLSEPPTPVKMRSRSPGRSPRMDRRSAPTGGRDSHRESKEVKEKKKKKKDESDSDDSESSSMESEHTDSQDSKPKPSARPHPERTRHTPSEWQMLRGLHQRKTAESVRMADLKQGEKYTQSKPEKHEGYMTKRRKWPMKGWHKRFFTLEKGILVYAKSPSDMLKGKLHGTVDVGLSVLTYKRRGRRFDIDTEDVIYHLKVKTYLIFDEWVQKFRHHRLYRQHELNFGTKDAPKLTEVTAAMEGFTPVTSPVSPDVPFGHSRGSFKSRTLERSQTKVAAWLQDGNGMEKCNKDLTTAQAQIFELSTLLEKMRHGSQSGTPNSEALCEFGDVNSIHERDKSAKKSRWKVNRKDKKHHERLTVPNGTDKPTIHTSSSNPNLTDTERPVRPLSSPDTLLMVPPDQRFVSFAESRPPEEFLDLAKSVHDSLRSLCRSITTERERLKHAVEHDEGVGSPAYVLSMRQSLGEVMKQNVEMRTKLQNVHRVLGAEDNLPSPPQVPSFINVNGEDNPAVTVTDATALTTSGSWESNSEFYDAAEYIVSSEESSEDEEEDASSDISDTETETTAPQTMDDTMVMNTLRTGRRSRLPAPKVETGDVSLWGLLCKNIGKDLSKISMPVTLNEPLSMLQRLCEELEYSELIDKAADLDDPVERMVLVAAFTVSPYAVTHYRAGQKPFNPLLGETYENIREDKGWSFIAEQVSHHPPISTCYCESKNFIFWQDTRIKTKFWGKSMEFQPQGRVNLKLPKSRDHYTWNKATTTIHNVLGAQRRVEHNGDVVVHNHATGHKCKITYAKSSYWSEKKQEVYGTITGPDGKVERHLFGKWTDGIYCGHAPSAKCVWRPGSMPDDYDLYYGFSRFAMELNETDHDQLNYYAPTDSRFRPDQKSLEDGRVAQAESEKQRLEQLQRDRRKKREDQKVTYTPMWFMKNEEDGKDTFMYTGKYWEIRKDPGFLKVQFPKLW